MNTEKMADLSALSIMDASPDCVKIITADGLIEYINQAGLQMIEATGSEGIIGGNVYDYIPQAYQASWRQHHEQVCAGQPMLWQYEVVGLKGTRRMLETYATPITRPDGTYAQMAVTRDITERISLQRSAHQTERKMLEIAEAIISMSAADDVKVLLDQVTGYARNIVGAHVAIISLSNDRFSMEVNPVVSVSVKYLEKDPSFFDQVSASAGWLIVPLRGRSGDILGSLRLFDKYEGGFTTLDEKIVFQLAQYAALILDRHQSMMRVQESELRFRTLANAIPNMAWMARADGHVYWYNDRWMEYSGMTMEEITGWGWSKLHHPGFIDKATAFSRQAWQQNVPFEIIHPMRGRDGNYKWFISRGIPILDGHGNVQEWIGTLTDIDEKQRGEERFRELANDAPLWIWTEDSVGLPDYANKAMLRHFSIKEVSEMESNFLLAHIHADDQSRWEDMLAGIERGGDMPAIECRIRSGADAPYQWFSLQMVQRRSNGLPEGYIGTAHNIDAQKNTRDALEQLVDQRASQIREANAALQKTNEQLAQFAHIASHDLKEPVRKIGIYAERVGHALETMDKTKANDHLIKIRQSIGRMGKFIDGVLQYASATSHQYEFEAVQLHDIVCQVIDDLEIVIKQKKAMVSKPETFPVIQGIPILLYQLLYNLVNNALKFSKPEEASLVEISWRSVSREETDAAGLPPMPGYVCINISDNGIGFDRQHAEKIFQTYTRLNKTSDYEGTGLGLALCRRVASLHHGSITAEGEPGKGAVFSIMLPVEQPC